MVGVTHETQEVLHFKTQEILISFNMKPYKLLINLIVGVGILFLIYFFLLKGNGESSLITEGDLIVDKIEKYKHERGYPPTSLSEIGMIIKDESDPPFYYDKRDSVNYTLSFVTNLGESKIYYSDSKKWEDRFREMK